MLKSAVISCLTRELRTLRAEIEAYPDERDLWKLVPGISNSGGTLALHLCGNLQHFIGHHLGGSAYVRDRPAEFARRDVPRAELLGQVSAAERAVEVLATLDDAVLAADFPEAVGGGTIQAGEFLVHLAVHCTYHLGQIDYHRRMVTGRNTLVPAVRPAELRTARVA